MSAASPIAPAPATATVASPADVGPLTVLGPSRPWQPIHPRTIWQYRDLMFLLALRDVRVRYKQTALGVVWAVIQPLLTMGVLSLVFGQVLGMAGKSDGVPYSLFLYSGLLPWLFFASCVHTSSASLVASAGMLQKVYFPRLVAPLASVGAPLVDLAVAGLVLAGMLLWHGQPLSIAVVLAPLVILSLLATALGVGILLAALTVSYRDFRHVIPFLVQIWFFATPVIVPARMLPAGEHWAWNLNPVAGPIGAFRAVVLDQPISWSGWMVSSAVASVVLAVGLAYFSRTERRFADVV